MRVLSLSADMATATPTTDEAKISSSTHKEAESTGSTTTLSNASRSPCVMTARSKIPTVVLDADVVTDNMAARLCVSLLGHVMFLKNQVPFPIMQLARIPGDDNASRAAKKRHELLTSFDTLTSHMYTTFIALSTAMALRGTRDAPKLVPGNIPTNQGCRVSRAFLSLVLGPTIGAAKSRVIVCIDGLEEKVWGLLRDEKSCAATAVNTREDGEQEGHSEYPSEPESESEEEDEEEEEEDDEESEQEEDGVSQSEDESSNASPPPSRSPSPSLSSGSPRSNAPPGAPLPPSHAPPPSYHVNEHDPLRAAERLLARTLASACAEDDGRGMASEMAPTQTHILLRAPRRFSHPSWTPRQNLCVSLDGYLADFLEESGETFDSEKAAGKKRKNNTAKIEGVWIKPRVTENREVVGFEEPDEEDEMIWWSWDGKLVGFADW
ncbi:hypothetical protein F5I97DRAFT_1926702 [Phlebopus sp. FC_14]|nr:hypothetical protein F5I97DRAFT_1926702 [Phlebopus sp. FC_14]